MPPVTPDGRFIVAGVLLDELMTVNTPIERNSTVGQAVRKLRNGVAQVVSDRFHLDPPLDPAKMVYRCDPPTEINTSLESLGNSSFTAHFYPHGDQQKRLINHIKNQPTPEEKMNEMLAAFKNSLRDEWEAKSKREHKDSEARRRREREELDAKWEARLQQTKAESEARLQQTKAESEAKLQQTKAESDAKWETRLQQTKAESEAKLQQTTAESDAKWEASLQQTKAESDAKWEARLQHTKAEWETKYNDLKQHLLEIEETALDTVGWITGNDTKMLDCIRLRHLINFSQEHLAQAAGLVTEWDHYGASLAWRVALGPSQDLATRLARARELLRVSTIQLDEPMRKLLCSDEGMSLVVEYQSKIRDRGDKVAHPRDFPKGIYDGPISRHTVAMDIPGLQILSEFAYTRAAKKQ